MADGSITRFEQGELNQYKKKQRNITFLPVKPRQPLPNAEISHETNNSGSTAVVAVAAAPAAHCLVISHAPNAASITTAPAILKSCEGIIRVYKKDTVVQDKIDKYIQFCAISGEEYVGGKVIWNGLSNVFAVSCVPYSATFQKVGKQKVFQCKACLGIQ